MNIQDVTPQLFDMARFHQNSPVAQLVRPYDDWGLPANVRYAPTLDAFVDDANDGKVIDDLSTLWVTDDVEVVNDTVDNQLLALIAGGLVHAGSVAIYVLGADAIDKLKASFRVVIEGQQYVVYQIDDYPTINPTHTHAVLNRL